MGEYATNSWFIFSSHPFNLLSLPCKTLKIMNLASKPYFNFVISVLGRTGINLIASLHCLVNVWQSAAEHY